MRPCTTQHNKSVKGALGIKGAKGAKGAECAMGAWGTGVGHGGSCGGSGHWDRIGQFSGQWDRIVTDSPRTTNSPRTARQNWAPWDRGQTGADARGRDRSVGIYIYGCMYMHM